MLQLYRIFIICLSTGTVVGADCVKGLDPAMIAARIGTVSRIEGWNFLNEQGELKQGEVKRNKTSK